MACYRYAADNWSKKLKSVWFGKNDYEQHIGVCCIVNKIFVRSPNWVCSTYPGNTKKDFGGVSKNESVEEYIKNYNENREQLIGSMDKDASFCPPILYAPSTDEINGFALSTTKKLVERIGIYFPEKVEKQKSKKTERTKV